jgi:hypothetical protein
MVFVSQFTQHPERPLKGWLEVPVTLVRVVPVHPPTRCPVALSIVSPELGNWKVTTLGKLPFRLSKKVCRRLMKEPPGVA